MGQGQRVTIHFLSDQRLSLLDRRRDQGSLVQRDHHIGRKVGFLAAGIAEHHLLLLHIQNKNSYKGVTEPGTNLLHGRLQDLVQVQRGCDGPGDLRRRYNLMSPLLHFFLQTPIEAFQFLQHPAERVLQLSNFILPTDLKQSPTRMGTVQRRRNRAFRRPAGKPGPVPGWGAGGS